MGMTQSELAKRLHLSFQQVQKYERGANRVSSGRLIDLAAALEVDIGYFYGLDEKRTETGGHDLFRRVLASRGGAKLMKAFIQITADDMQVFLVRTAEELAKWVYLDDRGRRRASGRLSEEVAS